MAQRGPARGPNWALWTIIGALILFFVILLLILFAGFWGWSANWNGTINLNACNDYDPCTGNYLLPDGSCTTRPFQNGTDCSSESYCYVDDTPATCCDGSCTNTNVTLCKGYCQVDADCVNDIPFNPNVVEANNTFGVLIKGPFCIAQSCVTYLIGGNADCSSWLDNSCSSTTENKYTSKCIETDTFTILPNNTVQTAGANNICMFFISNILF